MGDVISPDRSRPAMHKHVQVREYVRGLIQGADPGSPAPSERELVQHFGVARMTVRQALDALVSEGLLETSARPRHVRGPRQDRRAGAAVQLYRGDGPTRACSPTSRTLLARMEAAGPGVARALEIGEGDKVVHWQRLRLADGMPMCLEDAYLADSIVPKFIDQSLPDSLYVDLQRRDLMPTWGEDSVDASAARAARRRSCSASRRASRCCASPVVRSRATSPSRCPARPTGRTASRSGCRSRGPAPRSFPPDDPCAGARHGRAQRPALGAA